MGRGWMRRQTRPVHDGPVVEVCCGLACDDRCWELAVRERDLRRRVSTVGAFRVA